MLGMPGGALAGETRLWGTERPKRAQLTAPAPAMTPLRCLPSPATPLIETLKLDLEALKSEFEALKSELGSLTSELDAPNSDLDAPKSDHEALKSELEVLLSEPDASKSDLEALNEVGGGDWVDSRLMGEPCCEPHLLDVSVDESCRPPPARPFCW